MIVTKIGAFIPAATVSPSCVDTEPITPEMGAVSVAYDS